MTGAANPEVLVVPMHPGIQYHFARVGLPTAILGHWDQFQCWRPQPANVRNLLPRYEPEHLRYGIEDYNRLLRGLGNSWGGCNLAWLHFPWQVKLYWGDLEHPKIYLAAKEDELAPGAWGQLLERKDFTVASYYPRTTRWLSERFGVELPEIELGVCPTEYDGWTGEAVQVLTVIHSWKDRGWHHHLYGEAVRGIAAVHVDHLDRTKPRVGYAELRELFRKSRVYLHDGEREYTITLIEALMTGMPVVSFAVPGIEGYVEHGVNGFIGHDAVQIREYCRLLLADRELAGRMGVASRAKAVAKHDERRWQADWRRLIRSLV
jgi:hypothetical protein